MPSAPAGGQRPGPGTASYMAGCVAVLLLCAGCEDNGSVESRRCDRDITGSALDGQWQLRASGSRSGCSDRRLEGKLEFETAMPVRVTAEAQQTTGPAVGPEAEHEADAFVDRIERAEYLVEQGSGAPDGFSVTGAVSGSCFLVQVQEELPGGDRLRYELDGYIVERGLARGEFTGDGPEDCESMGSFTLEID